MRFLHTADIHLKKETRTRLDVLKWLVHHAEESGTEHMIIAGDLFDTDTDATQLRADVKKIFDKTGITIIILPGNHDLNAYGSNYDYGKRVIQLTETPFHCLELNGLTVCGVPYQNKKFSECIKGLPKDIDVLISHGTIYDETFIYAELDDEETQYMPIFPDHIKDTARYVAMGHLHSRAIELEYNHTRVIYPGSPVALGTKCTTERVCYAVKIDKRSLSIQQIHVDVSAHYLTHDFFVFPGYEDKILTQVESFIKNNISKKVMPLIFIKGFIGTGDKPFQKSVNGLKEKYTDRFEDFRINTSVQSWDKISQRPLVKNFITKTENIDNRLRMKMYALAFPVFDKMLK